MVYTYKDNKDLVLVIKNADRVKGLEELIGKLILASTGETPVEAEDVEASEVKEETPVIPSVTSDEEFARVSKDFGDNRYNGELRKEVTKRLNSYMISRFDKGLKDEAARAAYVDSLSMDEIKKTIAAFSSITGKPNFKKCLKKIHENPTYKDAMNYLIVTLVNIG